MKKIALVLILALACVFVVSAEVSLTGEFDYGFMAGDPDAGPGFTGKFDKIELDFAVTMDDYNTFKAEIEDADGSNDLTAGAAGNLHLGYAEIVTDWGAQLGLPIGIVSTVGYDGFSIGDDFDITGWSLEDLGGIGLATEGAGQLEIMPNDMITLLLAGTFDADVDNNPGILVGGTFQNDALGITVGFVSSDDTYAHNIFYTEDKYEMDLGNGMGLALSASLAYDLDYDVAPSLDGNGDGSVTAADVNQEVEYGAGAFFTVAAAGFGVSMNGNDDDAINQLGLDATYALTDALSADVGTIFDLTDDADDNFLGLDVSATYAIGGAAYTLGYLYSDGNGKAANYNSIPALADGGVYFKVCVDF
ncbi:hypothetical protein [Sediminispirochaeta smaragdinae]|uniref:Porin domain-containing protein n=1 Tax=Sediminispirochaeta smaragdinae (strain DSM 11293 / JCM 15392 / SEBR 4228) TaxID=573413 RepID=E1R7V1_SEDSS|nr:hypothetical protein [Sediminispirochaeta smaragdinae]ADK82806.1 hypothetical protein Spirs_3720 [Sediminispirochaeta smaragdinae DSM 11293]